MQLKSLIPTKVKLSVAILALVLNGCAQQYGGITHATVQICKDGTCTTAEITDGKEKQSVELIVIHPGGWKLKYSAKVVRAFTGQEIQAAVIKAISNNIHDVMPEVSNAITKSLIKSLIP